MEMHDDPGIRRPYRGPSLATIVFVAILFGAIAGFGGAILALLANQQGYLQLSRPDTSAAVPLPAGKSARAGTDSSSQGTFAQVADELDDSVVNINTLSHQQNPYGWFFGGSASQEIKGLGTGVIVDDKGYILTNFHVVGDAQNITVTVMHHEGKQEYTAQFIGGDKQEDLALIKINAKNLHPVKFGDSDKLRPGEWVMAIGNPFGFEHTVSVGVVSALNRLLPVDDAVTLRGMIQTDASINPGNSGGPLVNLNGEVVGMNTAIFRGGGGQPEANGIGFAIPSNHAVKVMEQLRNHRKVQHPYVGIRYELITDDVRKTERLPVREGVIVRGVYKDGPAQKAGLKPADIILSADGKPVTDSNTMADYINQQGVGKTLALKIERWDDQQGAWVDQTIRVIIEDMPPDFLRAMNQQEAQPDGGNSQPAPDDNGNNNGNGNGSPFPFPF